MNSQPNSDKTDSLQITGDAKPEVPVFVCLVYIHTDENAKIFGRVANLVGDDSDEITTSGNSERDVLSKLLKEFKSRITKLLAEGQEIPLIDPPAPPQENEQVRSIPMHL